MTRSVHSAVKNARFRSSPPREDRYTAGTALNQDADSKVHNYLVSWNFAFSFFLEFKKRNINFLFLTISYET